MKPYTSRYVGNLIAIGMVVGFVLGIATAIVVFGVLLNFAAS